MKEHRAVFDFEIEFSNGGGIQGQEFRLDSPGPDIADAVLAEAVVRDLGLLMVRSVRIHNKRVIVEPHKRRRPPADEPDRNRLIDVSHDVIHGMSTYPGLPGPVISDHLSREASRTSYAPGTEFQIGRIELVANTGTYVDAPFHRFADGADLASLPLERLAAIDGVVIDVAGSTERAIDRAYLVPYDLRGRAVLIRTGWDRHWGTGRYFEDHPFLTTHAADLLVERGAVLVGIDSLNVDDIADGSRPAHSRLLGAGIPVCEHLTNLAALPATGFRFHAVPVKIRGMGTFPVRAYAEITIDGD